MTAKIPLTQVSFGDEIQSIIRNNFQWTDDFVPPHANYLEVQVAYWRKCNQIHNWFVNENQGGEDVSGKWFSVDREKLVRLLKLCKKVLKLNNPEDAEELLPTVEGFFFGDTDYDEFYFGDLESTVEQLEKILENPHLSHCNDFDYMASW